MALKFTVSDSTGGLTWDHSDAELTHAEAQIVVSANIAHWLHSIAEALSEIARKMSRIPGAGLTLAFRGSG